MNIKKCLSILLGFLFVTLIISTILLVLHKNILGFFEVMFITPFTQQGTEVFNNLLVKLVPIIFTSLSFTIAFNLGLFNIGAEGQFSMGLLAALYIGSIPGIPSILHFVLILLASFAAGALWGLISSILKTRFNVHEVVSGIMLNYIALYLLKGWLLPLIADPAANYKQTKALLHSANLTDIIPSNKIFNSINFVNIIYLLIALILTFFIKYILNNTVLGYKIKAIGHNKVCSLYAGININKTVILSMLLASGLAGLGGAFYSFTVMQIYTSSFNMLGYGFNGLTASLIGGATVIGSVLGSFILSYLASISLILQQTLQLPAEIVDMISSLILYLIAIKYAFSSLAEKLLSKNRN